jgi:hypothetical protein
MGVWEYGSEKAKTIFKNSERKQDLRRAIP